MDIQSVGIVGAGQMGSGIAHVFALAGFDVLMTDISEDSLTKALSAGAVAPGTAASTFRTGAEDNPTSCRPGR